MAHFITSSLHAVAAGDISVDDAAYSLSAHLIPGQASDDTELLRQLKAIVRDVEQGNVTVLVGAQRMLFIKDRLAAGFPFEDVMASLPFSAADT